MPDETTDDGEEVNHPDPYSFGQRHVWGRRDQDDEDDPSDEAGDIDIFDDGFISEFPPELIAIRDDDFEVLPGNRKHSPRILVVDDDMFDCHDYAHALSAAGFEVYQVDNADSAIRVALRFSFVAAVVDVRMYCGNLLGPYAAVGEYRTGEALAKAIRSINDRIKIVALSNTRDPLVIAWFENLDNGRFVSKHAYDPRRFAKWMRTKLAKYFAARRVTAGRAANAQREGSTIKEAPMTADVTGSSSPAPRPSDRSPRSVIVIATGWGPSYGGINSFSIDFCHALGRVLRDRASVVCLTTNVDDHTRMAAEKNGVRILTLDKVGPGGHEAVARKAREVLEHHHIGPVDLVFGHDVITGPAALSLCEAVGGKPALFHHMSYIQYQSIKKPGASTLDMDAAQRTVLRQAPYVIGVGPLLKESAQRLCQRDIPMVVPGLADINPITHRAANAFRAITFGRMGGEDDPIKQGSLAVSGYGRYVFQAEASGLDRSHQFNMFGLSDDQYTAEEQASKQLMFKYSKRRIAVNATPYTNSRGDLFGALADSEVALMLSWHEGFGLVGWEAIAAGVPLVISKRTGLFKLLNDPADPVGAACVHVVDVQGSPDEGQNDADVQAVADSLFRISANWPEWHAKALTLRSHLAKKYTWDQCATSALQACEFDR